MGTMMVLGKCNISAVDFLLSIFVLEVEVGAPVNKLRHSGRTRQAHSGIKPATVLLRGDSGNHCSARNERGVGKVQPVVFLLPLLFAGAPKKIVSLHDSRWVENTSANSR